MAHGLVIFNISGRQFGLTTNMLDSEPESILAQLVRDQWHRDGCLSDVYIHRDPSVFHYVLNYLCFGLQATMPSNECVFNQLFQEAEFYQLHGLLSLLWRIKNGYPRIYAPLKVGLTVQWNPGVLTLYWQTVAITSRCFMPKQRAYQVIGRIKSKYHLKGSIWCCYDIACLACSTFDFALMSRVPDFQMLEPLVKREMALSRGLLISVSNNALCALVEWNGGSFRCHVPTNALLIA